MKLHAAAFGGEIPGLQAHHDVNERDSHGATPLMYAVGSGQLIAARQLIAAGCDMDAAADLGYTALMRAASSAKRTKFVQLLLDAGADPERKDGCGETALDWARANGHDAAVALLDAEAAAEEAAVAEEEVKEEEEVAAAAEEGLPPADAVAAMPAESAPPESVRLQADADARQEQTVVSEATAQRTREDYDALSFGALKDLCTEKGVSPEGSRDKIVERLVKNQTEEATTAVGVGVGVLEAKAEAEALVDKSTADALAAMEAKYKVMLLEKESSMAAEFLAENATRQALDRSPEVEDQKEYEYSPDEDEEQEAPREPLRDGMCDLVSDEMSYWVTTAVVAEWKPGPYTPPQSDNEEDAQEQEQEQEQ